MYLLMEFRSFYEFYIFYLSSSHHQCCVSVGRLVFRLFLRRFFPRCTQEIPAKIIAQQIFEQ